MIGAVLVGFDARAAFLDPHRGFGRVARCLADALLRVVPGEVLLFVPHGSAIPAPWYPLAAGVVELRRPRRAAFLVDGPAWRWTLRRRRVDVLHIPAWGVPPGLSAVPVVATGYDATPLRFPSPPGAWQRRRLAMALRSLRRAAAVHVISAHAGRELAALAGVPAARMHVVHLGAGAPFAPPPRAVTPAHLLFVGGLDPHKNVELLAAMLRLPGSDRLPPLVVAGPAAPAGPLAEAFAAGRARFVAARSDAELAALYHGALAVLLPSRNEGFGLPAVEAMACGCPVLAADAGALPEVCAGAAVLLSPDDPAAWRDAAVSLRDDAGHRRALVDAGLSRAGELTWERAARGLIEVYRAAILDLS
jgi:glycosyltransferase involved in cell wall biosynthesis